MCGKRHNLKFTLLLCLCILGSSRTFAQDVKVTIDGITYTCAGDTATVTGANPAIEEANIRRQIYDAGKTYTVTTVERNAFNGCNLMERAILPNTVHTIKYGAFKGCALLKELTIPLTITSIQDNAFTTSGIKTLYFNAKECIIDQTPKYPARTDPVFPEGLETVYIGDEVKTIPGTIFWNCKNLTKVKIGRKVNTIGASAFYGCTALTEITIPNATTSIGLWAFRECRSLSKLTIGTSVESIGELAFCNCVSLKEVTIPESIVSIGSKTFNGSTSLTKINFNAENCETCCTFPDSITTVEFGDKVRTIPANSFSGCTNLSTIKWGSSIEIIMSNAFKSCTALKEVSLPNSVTAIEENAFSDCTSLETLKLSESLKTLGYSPFKGCALTQLTIPETVSEVANNVFSGIPTLKKVNYNAIACNIIHPSSSGLFSNTVEELTIGNRVETIPDRCFYGLKSITHITLPGTVHYIGKQAFYGCAALTELTIPSGVTSIGESAFEGCTSIENVIYSAENCVISQYALPAKASVLTIDKNVRRIEGPITNYSIKTLNYNAKNCEDLTAGFGPNIETINFGDSVEYIPGNSFNTKTLKEITIPSSVTAIGANAFGSKDSGCSGLVNINTPSIEDWLKIQFANEWSNPIYYAKILNIGGIPADRLTIPEGTESINAFAFYNCESLVTVTLPTTLRSIGNYPFYGCKTLQSDIFPNMETCLGLTYQSVSARLENGNTSKLYINDQEFAPTDLIWPESINSIPDYALYNIKSLTNLNIPDNITAVGEGAFQGCGALTTVKFGNSVERIGKNAFNYADLRTITIPHSVISIEEGAFYSNSRLYEAIFYNSVINFGKDAFKFTKISNLEIENPANWALSNFETDDSNPLRMANSFKTNGETVETLYLDLGEESVSPRAFLQARNLKNLRVKAKSIGSNAFFNNNGIVNLCLDVDSIDEKAFSYCSAIRNIYSLTEDAPVAYDNSFHTYANVNLYVPQDAVSSYENTPACWWQFQNLYESDFKELDSIFGTDIRTDVDKICLDGANLGQAVYYNLNGVRAEATNLAPGIYIVRMGNDTKKIVVKQIL